MAVNITVVRYGGDRPGEDVVDPLLSTEPAAVARGFGLLNQLSVAHARVQLNTPYITNLRMGDIISATDSSTGLPIVGKVVAIRVVGTLKTPDGGGEPFIGMTLDLECPTDFAGV